MTSSQPKLQATLWLTYDRNVTNTIAVSIAYGSFGGKKCFKRYAVKTTSCSKPLGGRGGGEPQSQVSIGAEQPQTRDAGASHGVLYPGGFILRPIARLIN